MRRSRRFFGTWPWLRWLPVVALVACSTQRWNQHASRCKNRTSINVGVEDYISARYRSPHPPRAAFVAFDVPESFAFPGRERGNDLGRRLGIDFQREFHRSGALDLAEFFDHPPWLGRSEDFDSGNYEWIEKAGYAGYDLLFLGALRDLRDGEDLVISTKVIDLHTRTTLWSGDTTLSTPKRPGADTLARFGFTRPEPARLHLPERLSALVECAAKAVLEEEVP